jgi:hypothetical protein
MRRKHHVLAQRLARASGEPAAYRPRAGLLWRAARPAALRRAGVQRWLVQDSGAADICVVACDGRSAAAARTQRRRYRRGGGPALRRAPPRPQRGPPRAAAGCNAVTLRLGLHDVLVVHPFPAPPAPRAGAAGPTEPEKQSVWACMRPCRWVMLFMSQTGQTGGSQPPAHDILIGTFDWR